MCLLLFRGFGQHRYAFVGPTGQRAAGETVGHDDVRDFVRQDGVDEVRAIAAKIDAAAADASAIDTGGRMSGGGRSLASGASVSVRRIVDKDITLGIPVRFRQV